MGFGGSKMQQMEELIVKTHEKKYDGSFTTKKAEERQKEIERLRAERMKEIALRLKMIEENNISKNYFLQAVEQGEVKKKKKDDKKKSTKKTSKSTKKTSKSTKKTTKSTKKTSRSTTKKKTESKSKDRKSSTKKKDDDKKKSSKSKDPKKKDDKAEKKEKSVKKEKEKKDDKKDRSVSKKEKKESTKKGGKGSKSKLPETEKNNADEEDPGEIVKLNQLDEVEEEVEEDFLIAKKKAKFTKEQEQYFKRFTNSNILTQKYEKNNMYSEINDLFSLEEKQKLEAYFRARMANERVGITAFMQLPAITSSPISDYLLKAYDKELKGRRVTFNEFLNYLGVLHKYCKPEYK